MPRVLVLCCWLWLTTASVVVAADGEWPQWRGPNRDAVSKEAGLLKEWPSDGPPLEWRISGLGKGYSSIAIAAGKIFTMGDRGGQQFLIALDNRNGKELWALAVGKTYSDGPRCTPTFDSGMVYAITPVGDLVCVDANSGQGRWTKNFKRDFGSDVSPNWGFCESPLVDGDHLICSPGGSQAALVALDKKSGRLIWKCELPSPGNNGANNGGYSSVVVSQGAGVKQYVQLLGCGAVGVRANDGKFLWRYNRVANGTANIPTPIVSGDYVFCSTGYQTGSALLKLSRQGMNVSAEEVYFLDGRTLQNHHGGMVLVDGHIYCGHGHNEGFPICIELTSGKTSWKPGRGAGTGSAAVVEADGHLYFRYENGTMALIECTPEAYRLKGSFKIPEVRNPSWSHPVVAGGRLYLREQDNLYCYRLKAS